MRKSSGLADARAMLEEALLAAGGADYLAQLAQAQPVAFAGLLRALIPKQVEAKLDISMIFSPSQLRKMADELEHGAPED